MSVVQCLEKDTAEPGPEGSVVFVVADNIVKSKLSDIFRGDVKK